MSSYTTCPNCHEEAWFDEPLHRGCAACGLQLWSCGTGQLDLGIVREETILGATNQYTIFHEEFFGLISNDDFMEAFLAEMAKPVRDHEEPCPYSKSHMLWGPLTRCTCAGD